MFFVNFGLQTISDAREAYRNVSNIVRDTLSEAARAQQSTTSTAATSAEGDQMMMAAGNSAENEIAASSTAVAPPVDQQMAGQAFSKLFGRNYRGLRRLFDSELRTALKVGTIVYCMKFNSTCNFILKESPHIYFKHIFIRDLEMKSVFGTLIAIYCKKCIL